MLVLFRNPLNWSHSYGSVQVCMVKYIRKNVKESQVIVSGHAFLVIFVEHISCSSDKRDRKKKPVNNMSI